MEKETPMYLIQVQKQTAMTGEVVTLSANLPAGGDVKAELMKLGEAIDARVEYINDDVLKRSKGRYSIKDADMAAALGVPVDELFPKGNGKDH